MKYFLVIVVALFTLKSAAQYGVLDANFDADGILSTDIGGNWDLGYGVVQTPDGKLLACGYTSSVGNDIIVKKVHPDGSNDNSFGTNGLATLDYGSNDQAFSMVLQPDGKILLGGASTGPLGNDFAVIRLLENGSPDPSFGNNGLALVEIGTSSDVIYDIEIQTDGKIVGVGVTNVGINNDLALIRLNTDGSLDNTFSFDGKVTTTVEDDDYPRAVAIGPNGSITLAGFSQVGVGDHIGLLARYNSDGTLDDSFGVNGIVLEDFGTGDDELFDVVIDGSGKILTCGRTGNSSASDFLLAKFNSDGSMDNSFSFDGQVKVDFEGDYDHAYAMIVQPDSRILIGGYADDGSDVAHAMARFKADGSLDNTFGTSGKAFNQIGTLGAIRDITLQTDLKIVTCGYAEETSYDFIIARYTSGMNVGIGDVDTYIGSTLVYPNPVLDKSLTIEYELTEPREVQINLFEMGGKRVASLQPSSSKTAGTHTEQLNLPKLATGQYVLRLSTNQGSVDVRVSIAAR